MADRLSAAAIEAVMTHPIAVQVMESVDSTNTEAKRRLSAGLTEPLLLLAETQTCGRGRLGRAFCSPNGAGLYMSLVLHPDLPVERALSLTSAAAVAVCLAVESLTDLRPQIKWVNDVYVGDRKLCGILAEGITDPVSGNVRKMSKRHGELPLRPAPRRACRNCHLSGGCGRRGGSEPPCRRRLRPSDRTVRRAGCANVASPLSGAVVAGRESRHLPDRRSDDRRDRTGHRRRRRAPSGKRGRNPSPVQRRGHRQTEALNGLYQKNRPRAVF